MSPQRPKGQISGKKADELRRNRARLTELLTPSGPESGGGGDKDIAEALFLAAISSSVGPGGISNAGALARGSVFHFLRKRSSQSRGEQFFAEEHVGYLPEVAMGGLGLLRQADARLVADVLGVDVQRVREVQANTRPQDVDEMLRADYHSGRIEQAARVSMQDQGPDPDTPPEHLWRRGLDETLDLDRMNPRELALHQLSAANSNEPGAREAENRFREKLAQEHPQLADSVDRHEQGSRADANSVMAGASPQADGRPLESMEQYWAKAVPWFKDNRADLNKLRDDAESVSVAVLNGALPESAMGDMYANLAANKNLPGVGENLRKNLEVARARESAGAVNTFPQGDALLDTLDQARGYPTNSLPDRAETVAAGNAAKGGLRAHDAAEPLGPHLVLGDSRLPVTSAQLGRAQRENGSAVLRPDEARALGAQNGEGEARASGRGAGSHGARHPEARVAERRESRDKRDRVARTRAQGVLYRRGEAARAAAGDSPSLPTNRAQQKRAAGRLTAVHEGQRRRHSVTTTHTRTTTAR
ncbi:hypothetical protein OUQ99_01950 [Streptomonospora nanhaiensis]|uniref:Uncharacterized protein n=1 Tax=Streptomonospora nanhaiensis TaxID=1323731 RepID=A0ABY6YNK4_9ACTN|nr:hypothetical protein [Streptomonospora nanhaiensis]WAE73915.1 hypothetical protein OUQ99_01950 [Streptomonospora nanhaiensis]